MYDFLKWLVYHEESQLRFPSSAEEWDARKGGLRERLRISLGLDPWPERNPLHAVVVGTIEKRQYVIEKIVFESRKSFYINALVYRPKKQSGGRLPAVLNTVGHWPNSKSQSLVQARCAGEALHGCLAMTYDPIQQGERTGTGMLHDLEANASLCGSSVAGIMFWDGIRALDYLCSRADVDQERIAVTGASGGGLHAIFMSALDDRIRLSIPAVNLYTFESLVRFRIDNRSGPGCVCSYTPGILRYASVPYVYGMFAPKSMLILVGKQDEIFDIEGARRAHDMIQRLYALYGREDALVYKEFPCGHDYNRDMRNALYDFLALHFDAHPDHGHKLDDESELFPEKSEDLYVFPNGLLPEKNRTILDLTRELARRQTEERAQLVQSGIDDLQEYKKEKLEAIQSLLGHIPRMRNPQVVRVYSRNERLYTVEKFQVVFDVFAPLLLKVFTPKKGHERCMMLVRDNTEVRFNQSNRTLLQYIQNGFMVATIEFRGNSLVDVNDPILQEHLRRDTLITGCPLPSLRVAEVLHAAEYLRERGIEGVELFGQGYKGSLIALLAAALDERIERVKLERCLISFSSLIERGINPDLDIVVPGLLKHVDIPDLLLLVFPRPVEISAVRSIPSQMYFHVDSISERFLESNMDEDPGVELATSEELARAYAVVIEHYRKAGKPDQFIINGYAENSKHG